VGLVRPDEKPAGDSHEQASFHQRPHPFETLETRQMMSASGYTAAASVLYGPVQATTMSLKAGSA
jgi:hypothetical protein